MEITRERIQERLRQLIAERDQLAANLQAYNGAVQDCEYWLIALAEVVAEQEVAPEPESDDNGRVLDFDGLREMLSQTQKEVAGTKEES